MNNFSKSFTNMFAPKLNKGDLIRVVAPARSLKLLDKQTIEIAVANLESLGLKVDFGHFVNSVDEFLSSPIRERVADIHSAFADTSVKGILTVIGGFNSNQLLDDLDWQLIAHNPKIFCGFSDITVLLNAIFAQTGLVTYYGPHFSTFGQKQYLDYTKKYFARVLMEGKPRLLNYLELNPSKQWLDDQWWLNQDNRNPENSDGYWVIQPGEASGRLIGGNLRSFSLLKGSKYMPFLTESVLLIEDDCSVNASVFERELQAMIHLPDFEQVRGILIGRFQKESQVNRQILTTLIKSKPKLCHLPILANLDFGHTDPKLTLPIGGTISFLVNENEVKISLLNY